MKRQEKKKKIKVIASNQQRKPSKLKDFQICKTFILMGPYLEDLTASRRCCFVAEGGTNTRKKNEGGD